VGNWLRRLGAVASDRDEGVGRGAWLSAWEMAAVRSAWTIAQRSSLRSGMRGAAADVQRVAPRARSRCGGVAVLVLGGYDGCTGGEISKEDQCW